MNNKPIKIKIKPKKPSVGHQPNTHQVHEDKRTKRNRTRSDQNRRAIEQNK